MHLQSIPLDQFQTQPTRLWLKQWLVLSCGDFAANDYNSMTVGWGSIGGMWRKPFVQVVVRFSRYTLKFMDKYDTFTLCAFPEKYRKAVQLIGTKSGRDGDKIAESRLTPMASTKVAAPCFKEAELIIECRKTYWQDMNPDNFLDESIADLYADHDYHRIYFGEILAAHSANTQQ